MERAAATTPSRPASAVLKIVEQEPAIQVRMRLADKEPGADLQHLFRIRSFL